MTEADWPGNEPTEYRYTVSARTEDGREAIVTFGPTVGAAYYAEYWTGPSPWWKRARQRAIRLLRREAP